MTPTLTTQVTPESLEAHDTSDVLVALTIDAEAAPEQPTSTRHIALCLDASGSMMSGRTDSFDVDLSDVDSLAEASDALQQQLDAQTDADAEDASRLDHAKAGALNILDELEPDDYITVVAFGTNAATEVDPIQLRNADREELADAISTIETRGKTDILDGLETARENLHAIDTASQASRQIILLTDGKDNKNDDDDFERVLPDIRSDGISVMAGGIGPYDDELLATIADKTDGISQHLEDPADIESFIETTVSDAGNVVLSDPNLHVRSGEAFELVDARVRVSTDRKDADDKARDIEQAGDIKRIQLPDVAAPMTQQVLLQFESTPRPPGQTAVVADLDLWAGGEQRAQETVTVDFQNEETGIKPKVENDYKRIQVRSDLKSGDTEAAEQHIDDVEDDELAIELRDQTDLKRTEL
jgi:hypothetical protein